MTPLATAPAPGTGAAAGGGGLTSEEAAARLGRDGPNILPVVSPPRAWRLLAGQMTHFFAAMLWAAGA